MTEPCPETGSDLALWLCFVRASRYSVVFDADEMREMILNCRANGHYIITMNDNAPELENALSFRESFDAIAPYMFAWQL